MRTIILASKSPRRKEILELAGISCKILPSRKDEVITKSEPEEAVKELSFIKAKDAAEQAGNEAVIIAADTIVYHNNKIMGKPADEKEAFGMLSQLQGNTHSVYTGVTIMAEGTILTFAVETKVTVVPMAKEEILLYLSAKESFDKAGAYGIQGRFAPFIEKIDGDYYNVMGLPISTIYQKTKEVGILLKLLEKTDEIS